MFVNTIIDFVIIAFAIFIIVKQLNKMKKKPAPAPPNTKDCPYGLSAIPIKATRCGHCTSEVAAQG
jgi:large conductance mechanosensitive channel